MDRTKSDLLTFLLLLLTSCFLQNKFNILKNKKVAGARICVLQGLSQKQATYGGLKKKEKSLL